MSAVSGTNQIGHGAGRAMGACMQLLYAFYVSASVADASPEMWERQMLRSSSRGKLPSPPHSAGSVPANRPDCPKERTFLGHKLLTVQNAAVP